MKAGDKNFMAAVDLLQAKESIEKAYNELEDTLNLGAVQHIRFAIHKLSDALEEIYRTEVR